MAPQLTRRTVRTVPKRVKISCPIAEWTGDASGRVRRFSTDPPRCGHAVARMLQRTSISQWITAASHVHNRSGQGEVGQVSGQNSRTTLLPKSSETSKGVWSSFLRRLPVLGPAREAQDFSDWSPTLRSPARLIPKGFQPIAGGRAPRKPPDTGSQRQPIPQGWQPCVSLTPARRLESLRDTGACWNVNRWCSLRSTTGYGLRPLRGGEWIESRGFCVQWRRHSFESLAGQIPLAARLTSKVRGTRKRKTGQLAPSTNSPAWRGPPAIR